MAFFHTEQKKDPPRSSAPSKVKLRDLPVAAMAEMGCKVCPKDKDRGDYTKVTPAGYTDAVHIYVLFASASPKDGFPSADSRRIADVAMDAVLGKLPSKSRLDIRVGGLIQCASETQVIGAAEQACCRNRVEEDIEKAEPLVILGVGDAPLAWATELPAYAPTFRGRMIRVKIRSHVCWYYPVNYPNWAFKDKKKQYGKSEHELALEHDIKQLVEYLESHDAVDVDNAARRYYFPTPTKDENIECITGTAPGDMQRLERALADAVSNPRNALDIETNALRPYIPTPMLLTAAIGTFDRTVAFAVDHPQGWGSDVQRRKVAQLFGEWLMSCHGTVECHNLAMEMEWLAYQYGVRLLHFVNWDDTMAQAHTIDERPGTKSLDVLTRIHFGFFLKSLSSVDVKRANWWLQYSLKDILLYNGRDTKWTHKLSEVQRPILLADDKLTYQWQRKVRLAPSLVAMELKGLPVDIRYAEKMETKLEDQAKVALAKVARCPEVGEYERKFGRFSPTNPDHVLTLLDKICRRDEIKRTDPTGRTRMTTDEEALSAIPANEVPSAALVLEHRGVEKLLSTYIRPITTRRIISADGRIHSKYSSMVAVTGRLAGEDPNPQNWPKRKHREIRGAVSVIGLSPEQWVAAYDYGQIEFRVVGMASEDDNLVRYCWDPKSDVHKKWAVRVTEKYGPIKDWIIDQFDVDWDEKGMKTLRQEMKNKWVFPMLFGSSARSCAASLQLPKDIADDMAAEFWDEFPQVKKWQAGLLKSYEKKLYVETLGGNRRRGPMTMNEIINMPIQGTAAEIVCEAMCALSEMAVVEENDDLQPALNVHDDLTFLPFDKDFERNNEIIVREMCKHRFPYINVPLVVEASIGPRWSELEEIGVYRSSELFNLENPYA